MVRKNKRITWKREFLPWYELVDASMLLNSAPFAFTGWSLNNASFVCCMGHVPQSYSKPAVIGIVII